jgi:hypothetical protein
VNDHPSPTPVVAPDAAIDAATDEGAHQQCGRCRQIFEMEPLDEPGTLREMWLCAPCRVALLGRPTTAKKALS